MPATQAQIAALQARRAARGMADPLNRLRAVMAASDSTAIVEQPAPHVMTRIGGPEMYATWKDWNDAEIKLLQKRNKAERDYRATGCPKAKARHDKALAAIEAHKAHRIASSVQQNFVRG